MGRFRGRVRGSYHWIPSTVAPLDTFGLSTVLKLVRFFGGVGWGGGGVGVDALFT